MVSAAGCIRGLWKGAETGNGCHVAGKNHLSVGVVVGGHAKGVFVAAGFNQCVDVLERNADNRSHAADPERNRLLHGIASGAEQPRGVGKGKDAGGAGGRIFAERMTGNKCRLVFQVNAEFFFENADDGH